MSKLLNSNPNQSKVPPARMPVSQFQAKVAELRALSAKATSDDELRRISSNIARISRQFRIQYGIGLPASPLKQAQELDPDYRNRPHIEYLSDRILTAVEDVERGMDRNLVISMPPRSGKSTLVSYYTPLWLLRRHPEWKQITTSYDGSLTGGWAKDIRTMIEDRPDLGIALKRDGGAGGRWTTLEGGGIWSDSTRGNLTGRGAKVFIIDDPIKDFVEAHSETQRETLWNWWLSVAQTRLEHPTLVLVVMTRWHEDDFVGRLLSKDHAGNPVDWENIRLPALAEEYDVLDRAEGEPLLSPLIENETVEQAVARWEQLRDSVGSYTFASMFQQRPSPAKGAIFDTSWWHYWTTDKSKTVDDEGNDVPNVHLIDPDEIAAAQWVDSWDTSFKSSSDADWVVGQRWAKFGANRYLISQKRGKWNFTKTLEEMVKWAVPDNPEMNPNGHLVHQRLIEGSANGPAIIQTLKSKISGLKEVNPRTSKEARGRAVSPEVESGNVFLPHPGDPGNEWVRELLDELRNFPHGTNDDQVDALTQALNHLRDVGQAYLTIPGQVVLRQSPMESYRGVHSRRDIPSRPGGRVLGISRR